MEINLGKFLFFEFEESACVSFWEFFFRYRPVPLPVWMSAPQLEPQPIGQKPTSRIHNPAEANAQLRQMQRIDFSSSNSGSKKRGYDEMERETNDSPTYNRQDSFRDEEEENDPNDSVRLWEEGWRERYYKNKFNVGKDDLQTFRIEVAQHYARGLCWVLQYYYQGVPAWDWYENQIFLFIVKAIRYFVVLGIFLIIMHHLPLIFCN